MPDEELSRVQSEAVCHTAGAMLLLASPGSGKTFTLVRRVRQLIECAGAAPEQILVLTFTKAAAKQMQSRFLSLTDGAYREVTFGTFHAVYYHILRSIPAYYKVHLITQKQKDAAAAEILGRHSWPVKNDGQTRQVLLTAVSQRKKETCLADISQAAACGKERSDFRTANMEEKVRSRIGVPEREESAVSLLQEEKMAQFVEEYEEYCSFRCWLDFDDLILYSLRALQEQEAVRKVWQERFVHILVDEFQDISPLQYEVLKLLAHPQDNLFVVGDDDQSIYGFRGAAPGIMRQFLQDFPGAVKLEMADNFRSSRTVTAVAQRVIQENKDRFDKRMRAKTDREGLVELLPFSTGEEEAVWLCGRFAGQIPERLSDTAVIVRTHAQAERLAEHFLQEKIPFFCQEPLENFYEKPAVLDVLAYLRFAQGECGRGIFLRFMNRPVRYLERELLEEPAISLNKLRERCRNKPFLQEILRKLQMNLARLAKMRPEQAVNYVRQNIGYDSWLRENCQDSEVLERRLEELRELERRGRRFDEQKQWLLHVEDCERLAGEQEKSANSREGKDGRKGLQLMTMHASKGLEFQTVYLPGLNEGTLPYRRAVTPAAVEEERRLFYVGMTRAKETLCLSYIKNGTESCRPPSRFLTPLFQSSAVSSSNSARSKNSSKASATFSYSVSSSI